MKTLVMALAFLLSSSLASAKTMVGEGVRLDMPNASCLLEIDMNRSAVVISEAFHENVLSSFVLDSSSNGKMTIEKSSGSLSVEINNGSHNFGCRVLESNLRTSN